MIARLAEPSGAPEHSAYTVQLCIGPSSVMVIHELLRSVFVGPLLSNWAALAAFEPLTYRACSFLTRLEAQGQLFHRRVWFLCGRALLP
jgi:hypothetical protein